MNNTIGRSFRVATGTWNFLSLISFFLCVLFLYFFPFFLSRFPFYFFVILPRPGWNPVNFTRCSARLNKEENASISLSWRHNIMAGYNSGLLVFSSTLWLISAVFFCWLLSAEESVFLCALFKRLEEMGINQFLRVKRLHISRFKTVIIAENVP